MMIVLANSMYMYYVYSWSSPHILVNNRPMVLLSLVWKINGVAAVYEALVFLSTICITELVVVVKKTSLPN